MILDLQGYKYDTELDFESQEQSTIDFINGYIASNDCVYNFDDYNRPFEAVYKIDDNEIVVRQIFGSQSVSCDLLRIETLARGFEIWHDKTKSIQVIMSIESQMAILSAYPEFAIFTVQGCMPSFVEGRFIYLYDNTLAEEYRQLIQYFGGTINDKNI